MALYAVHGYRLSTYKVCFGGFFSSLFRSALLERLDHMILVGGRSRDVGQMQKERRHLFGSLRGLVRIESSSAIRM